jgi:hypothetical protein
MSFGKHIGRLLSPLAVLIWLAVIAGFAGTAQADTSPHAAPQADEHAQTSPSSTGQADAHAQATASASASADHAQVTETHSPSPSDHADHGPTTADLTKPQPLSNADQNSGGANGQCPGGPYCSTRDGSAAQNGNGGGAAVGKPCAGCVGKADNKNPHGQMPNGSDANAGYECDTNHGVGRSNPAHTGCQSQTPPVCVPSPTETCGQAPPPVCVPSPTETCGQTPPPVCVPSPTQTCGQTPPLVSPPTAPSVSAPVTAVPVQAAAAPASASLPSSAVLPQTGAPRGLVGEAALAVLVMLAGAALIATTRRPRQDS